MVQSQRTSSDSVRLWNDELKYLTVARIDVDDWAVRRHRAGVLGSGVLMGNFASAREAVEYATDYLQSGQEELDNALGDLGLSQ